MKKVTGILHSTPAGPQTGTAHLKRRKAPTMPKGFSAPSGRGVQGW